MNTPSNQQPGQGIVASSLRRKWILLAPTAICALAGLLYVQFGQQREWTATERLVISDDFGKELRDFAGSSDFLRSVVRTASINTTQHLDPDPEASQVQLELTSDSGLSSGRGSSGKALCVQVSAGSKESAVELAKEVCRTVEAQLRVKLSNAIDENVVANEQARQAVASDLEEAEERLAELPRQVEIELGLAAEEVVWTTGDSALKRKLDRITVAAARLEEQRLELQQEWKLTQQFLDNPARVLESSLSGQERNAKLKELRQGWAASLIQITEMKSRYTEAHPLLIAARETEQSLAARVEEELQNSAVLLERDLESNQSESAAIEKEQVELQVAMGRLKTFLNQYSDGVESAKQKQEELAFAKSEYATAMSRRELAATTNLVIPQQGPALAVVEPDVKSTTVVAGATLSGLILGCGLIFLFKPLDVGLNNRSRKEQSIKGETLSESAQTRETVRARAERTSESDEEILLNELAATVTELRIAEDTNTIEQDASFADEEMESKEDDKSTQAKHEFAGVGPMKFSEEADSPPQPK